MTDETSFFSYSRSDSDFVLKLAKDLRDAGAQLWIDQLDIKGGSPWDSSVEAALESSKRMIVVLSSASVASKNVLDEISFALEYDKHVIPILISECTPPFRLRRLHRIDFTRDYQTGVKQLLELLGKHPEGGKSHLIRTINTLEGKKLNDESKETDIDEKKNKALENLKKTPAFNNPKSKHAIIIMGILISLLILTWFVLRERYAGNIIGESTKINIKVNDTSKYLNPNISNAVDNLDSPKATTPNLLNLIEKFDTVKIGKQVYMLKNLDVRTYQNGDIIPEVRDEKKWGSLTTGAWCWYINDSANYGVTYGKLYNWYAVNDSRGLAPNGWHVPSDAELIKLTTYLGGALVAGGKMKEAGTSNWLSPNLSATNISGFTFLPGGLRDTYGVFRFVGEGGHLWSTSENKTFKGAAWDHFVYNNMPNVYRDYYGKGMGASVRCLKD